MLIANVIQTKAGEFVCDTPEHFFWMQKHLERYKETADEMNQELVVVAYYRKRDDSERVATQIK